ncbi:MAG: VCBS repeat-containing protein [Bacteroidetes bacterium]|nr:VCBS repeat-containing protein [Bacteroidota bacterium]
MIENKGNGKFVMHELPIEAQFSTAYGIVIEDFNNDGDLDILLAGNFYVSEVETGRADAGIGLLMEGNGNNGFTPVPVYKSGFYAPHDVRDLALLNTDKGAILIIANNNDKPQLYRVKSLVNQPAGEALAIK